MLSNIGFSLASDSNRCTKLEILVCARRIVVARTRGEGDETVKRFEDFLPAETLAARG